MKKPKGAGKPVIEPQAIEAAIREMAGTSTGMRFLLETWLHTPGTREVLGKWLDTPEGQACWQAWILTPDGGEFLMKQLNDPNNIELIEKHHLQKLANIARNNFEPELAHRPMTGEQTRQVKFECSEDFYKRLREEKLQRNLTFQQLATRALERYMAVPESVHCRLEEAAKKVKSPGVEYVWTEHGMSMVESHSDQVTEKVPELSIKQRKLVAQAIEVNKAIEAVHHYLEQLPPEKVHMVREALALDLKYYRRSRLKQLQKRKRDFSQGSSETEGDA